MNFEQALLGKIIETGNLSTVIRAGITADFFYDLPNRELFLDLVDHQSKFGQAPSLEYLAEMFPDLELGTVPDSLESIIERVQEKRIYNEVASLLEKATEELREDSFSALRAMQNRVASVVSLIGKEEDVDITKCPEEVRAEYLRMKMSRGLLGIPWPWPALNTATQGMHPGNLIFIFGRPKTKKSFILQYIANHVHVKMHKRVVFSSQEMSVVDIRRRGVCFFCELPYQDYRAGKLTTREERDFFANLEAWEEQPPYVVTRLHGIGADAVSEFEAKLREHQAEIGFFDGVYLAGGDWESMVAITRGLKRLAQNLGIPILGTCQENREGQTAYSDSFLQDCDVLLRTVCRKEEMIADEVLIQTPALREAKLNGFAVQAVPCVSFAEKYRAEEDNEEAESRWEGQRHEET